MAYRTGRFETLLASLDENALAADKYLRLALMFPYREKTGK